MYIIDENDNEIEILVGQSGLPVRGIKSFTIETKDLERINAINNNDKMMNFNEWLDNYLMGGFIY